MYLCLGFYVLSSEKAGINGPCTWPDHCGRSAKNCQHDGHPRITDVSQGDPQFDDGDQSSYHRCPEADEEEYPGAGANNLQNHRGGSGWIRELENTEANEHGGGQDALKEKTDTWPAAGEGGKKPLQESLR